MKILALGDTHLGLFKGRTKNARNTFAKYCQRQFQYCIDKAIKLDVDLIIHTGDVFNRSQPPNWILNHYYQTIERALAADIAVAVIPGNHDRSNIDHSLLDYFYPNYYLFNSLRSVEFENFRLIGLPYCDTDIDDIMEQVYTMCSNSTKPVVVITHQLFQGATFGPHEFTFTTQESVIDLDLPDNTIIISGHIHRAQILNDAKIIYTGSTVRTSFAEIIEPKGYLLIDVDEKGVDIKFVEIPTKPMKVIEIDGRQPDMDKIRQMINESGPDTELLIRTVHSRTNKSSRILRKLLIDEYSAESWPYLTLHDGGDNLLRPMYSTYSGHFRFPNVKRKWHHPVSPLQNTILCGSDIQD